MFNQPSGQKNNRKEDANQDQGRLQIMKMPFGKHKGQEIHTIPHDYLQWFKENIANLHGDLLRAVEAGLDGKPFDSPTSEERVDEARKKMLERLRQREMTS